MCVLAKLFHHWTSSITTQRNSRSNFWPLWNVSKFFPKTTTIPLPFLLLMYGASHTHTIFANLNLFFEVDLLLFPVRGSTTTRNVVTSESNMQMCVCVDCCHHDDDKSNFFLLLFLGIKFDWKRNNNQMAGRGGYQCQHCPWKSILLSSFFIYIFSFEKKEKGGEDVSWNVSPPRSITSLHTHTHSISVKLNPRIFFFFLVFSSDRRAHYSSMTQLKKKEKKKMDM